jgi:transcriptional regulator with XRE-family HTH domain
MGKTRAFDAAEYLDSPEMIAAYLSESSPHDEAIALTKATICAAESLGLSQKILASVIGLSEPTVSRIKGGAFVLERGKGKAFELAQLLVLLYELLDRVVAGDELATRAWLIADNSALGGRPIDLIQSAQGLATVVGYLHARS